MTGLFTRGVAIPLGALAMANIGIWFWAINAFAARPSLLGSALLAWLFGLRHAADADHLAAIDNVVRKLLHEGQRARMVGLFFSLGHSTIVILACVLIAGTASTAAMERFHAIGSGFGTALSAGFLVLIACVNLTILVGMLRRDGGNGHHVGGGVLTWLLRPATRLIRRPAHMYPLGFLFGLGFDTATEVSLLALAATQAAAGVSFTQVLIFPALFTAGMALVDTADSLLMVGAYGWALADARRKHAYNLIVTSLSVVLALGIGGLEAAGLVVDRLGWEGHITDMLAAVADRFTDIGFGIIALFAAAWATAAFIYRRRVAIDDQVAVQPPSTS